MLTGRASPHPRKLFWRFKAGAQRAMRDGDWKYLRIAGNEFLFDVVKDPRERANLKDRHKDVFDRLKSDWEAWNDTMLPERPRPAAYGNPGNFMADHYGVVNPPPAAVALAQHAHDRPDQAGRERARHDRLEAEREHVVAPLRRHGGEARRS